MKAVYSILLFLSVFTFHAAAQGKGNLAEVVIKTEVFCSHCQYCESCRPRIESALFNNPGVKQAKLDVATQTIKVTYNPKKTTVEEIKKNILASGYAADGEQPAAKDYDKLEACCKKK